MDGHRFHHVEVVLFLNFWKNEHLRAESIHELSRKYAGKIREFWKRRGLRCLVETNPGAGSFFPDILESGSTDDHGFISQESFCLLDGMFANNIGIQILNARWDSGVAEREDFRTEKRVPIGFVPALVQFIHENDRPLFLFMLVDETQDGWPRGGASTITGAKDHPVTH